MQNKDITSFATGFKSFNATTSTSAVTVISVESADIIINTDAAAIILKGAIHYQAGPTKDIEAMFNVSLKIASAILERKDGYVFISVNRHEMDYLRHFTECYLTHNEDIKVKDPEKFDADMYITGKLLLLDIRQWQVGEVIFKEIIS